MQLQDDVEAYDRASAEHVGLDITVAGQPATSGIEVAVTPVGTYPVEGDYADAVPGPGGVLGFASGPRPVGRYTVRVRVGVVVLRMGYIDIV